MFADPSLGPFVPGNPQLHDFNPGDLNVAGQPDWIGAGGVFWTMAIDPHEISSKPGKGDVTIAAPSLAVKDFTSVVNSILRQADGTPTIPTVPATASVDATWRGTGDRLEIGSEGTETSEPFAARYRAADATVRWTGSTSDYSISVDSSTDDDVTISHAFTAKVRNGVFL